MDYLFQIFVRLIVVFTALPVHEFAHGYIAQKLGDDTARAQGRLTLNPFAHLDLVGSVLILLTGFGWAKPVPVNPYRFRHPKRDMAFTALAGPVSNLLLATVFMVIYKLLGNHLLYGAVGIMGANATVVLAQMLLIIIVTNVNLAVFNLIPVPPLDGSKIFGALIPDRYYFKMMEYQQYIAIGLLVLLISGVLDTPLSYLSNLLLNGINAVTSFL